ncbi:sensor histidine kinase [Arthrobacter sp. PM3]|uniref:sensor histidine kinase n=1 Tax=Arthrobacter sp. PM3 TaxID=2017685 RepID=UPI0021C4A98D|nr:histidine kinase [Arthrobacter sp. PM3]
MEPLLKVLRHWGAPAAAVLFFTLWCVGEAGRMGPGLHTWPGTWPLVLMTAAIALAAWKPYASLGCAAALPAGQFLGIVPPMEANHWAIYLGAFVALGFIQWTAGRRTRFFAAGANLVFAGAMTFLMLSWRYSAGLGWFPPLYMGDRWTLRAFGWQLFSLLLLIAAACAAVGLALALYEERGSLFRARSLAQSSLREAEVDLIVEQERTRIGRDLHDVLAHSLAVIAAQADGTRYLSKDQPKAVLTALENISTSARSALVDAQRVIEGVHDDGPAAPQPGLNDVVPLVEGMQGSLAIERSESGAPVELSGGQQLAVFRIIQECLTNALKHGGRGTAVRLHLDWSGPGLTLHVASGIRAAADSPDPAADVRVGRGLAGMRERAHLAGGWVTAGPDGEQYRVTAFLPYGTRSAEAAAPGAESQLVPAGGPAGRRQLSLEEAGHRG